MPRPESVAVGHVRHTDGAGVPSGRPGVVCPGTLLAAPRAEPAAAQGRDASRVAVACHPRYPAQGPVPAAHLVPLRLMYVSAFLWRCPTAVLTIAHCATRAAAPDDPSAWWYEVFDMSRKVRGADTSRFSEPPALTFALAAIRALLQVVLTGEVTGGGWG